MERRMKTFALISLITLLALPGLGLAEKGGKGKPPKEPPPPANPAIAFVEDGHNLIVMNADGEYYYVLNHKQMLKLMKKLREQSKTILEVEEGENCWQR